MRLNQAQGEQLLEIARQAINAQLMGRQPPVKTVASAALNQTVGCFVTIEMAGRLRGCIGNFTSQQPLYHEVAQMAVAAASEDPRFLAMTSDDIGHYQLDISILSPLEKIEDTDLIEVGTHGIYLQNGGNRGVLLPQVAREQGWDRLTFLEQTCVKAGLPKDAWQAAQTDIFIFSAQIFSDNSA